MNEPDRNILDARDVDALRGAPSFTLSNRIYRNCFNIAWVVFARWTPPQWSSWRSVLLKLFGARMGVGAKVYPSARIWSPANLEMGPYACIGPGVTVYSMAPISLDAHALVSQGAHLCTGTHDVDNLHFQLYAKPIQIGAWAWIAAEAFVGPGVCIGPGAVLGARAVAFSDIDEWTIYVGNPAKAKRRRNAPISRSSPPDVMEKTHER